MTTHIVLALVSQTIIWRLSGSPWIGAIAAISFFVGREITQTNYRWMAKFGDGSSANLPMWGRLDPRAWTLKSLGDWVSPRIVVILVAIFWRGRKKV